MSKKKDLVERVITIGDIVVLKSGGPKMTVAGKGAFDTAVEVLWADNQSRIAKATIGIQALKHAK